MKVLALILLVSLIGVGAQDPSYPPPPLGGNPNEPPQPPRDKFFEIIRCIVLKYCRTDPPQCLAKMEECAKEVLGGNTPQQGEMKATFRECVLDNGLQWDDNIQPGQPPSIDYSQEEKCKIMECIMKKNNTFDSYVACINRGSSGVVPPTASKRKH